MGKKKKKDVSLIRKIILQMYSRRLVKAAYLISPQRDKVAFYSISDECTQEMLNIHNEAIISRLAYLRGLND